MEQKRTSVFENGLIWFGAGVSVGAGVFVGAGVAVGAVVGVAVATGSAVGSCVTSTGAKTTASGAFVTVCDTACVGSGCMNAFACASLLSVTKRQTSSTTIAVTSTMINPTSTLPRTVDRKPPACG